MNPYPATENSGNSTAKLRNLPTCFLVIIGHCGNDWLHTLLDSHSQILTLPLFSFYRIWRTNNCDAIKDVDSMFLSWQQYLNGSHEWHNRRENLFAGNREREIFFSNFRALLKSGGISRRNVFWALHESFVAAKEIDIPHIRLVFAQEHTPFSFHLIMQDFPETRILILMRDPRAAIAGSFRYIISRVGYLPDYNFDMVTEMWLQGLDIWNEFQCKLGSRMKVIRNEDLNRDLEPAIRELAEWLEVDYSDSMLHSTVLGKPWAVYKESAYIRPGDSFPESMKEFYSPEKARERWRKELSEKEVLMIEFLFREFMDQFRYKCQARNHFLNRCRGLSIFLWPHRGLIQHWFDTYPQVHEFGVVSKHLGGRILRKIWNALPSPVKLVFILGHSILVRVRCYFFPGDRGRRYDNPFKKGDDR